MTEREKNGERLALRMSRHRQAKHESLKDEDVKTAYIKGCEDTAQEMTWKYEKQKEINKELVDELAALQKENADILNTRKEAAAIVLDFYERLKDFPTCDNSLIELRKRALEFTQKVGK